MTFGQAIKAKREALGMTQQELAENSRSSCAKLRAARRTEAAPEYSL